MTTTTARLHGEIDPGGQATSYRFEYLTRQAYEANLDAGEDGFEGAATLPEGGANLPGGGPVTVTPLLFGLSPGTAYRYRLKVANLDGEEVSAVFNLVTHTDADFALADNRGWEMVSPVDKNGGQIAAAGALGGGGMLRAAAGGGAVTYGSASSFAGPAEGAPFASQYVSRRGTGGWSTENISVPGFSATFAGGDEGVPYRLFAADLSRSLLLNGRHCRGDVSGCPVANPPLPGTGAPAGYQNFYLRESATGVFKALIGAADILHTELTAAQFRVSVAGASPDLAQVYLSTCAALTPDAAEALIGDGCDSDDLNLYRWTAAGGLQLVGDLPGQLPAVPGEPLGASEDGSRVYYQDAEGLKLWQDGAGGGTTREIAAGAAVADPSSFPAATGTARVSADGSRLLFMSTEPLTGYDNTQTATGGPTSQLFLYNADTDRLTCISCNPTHARPLGPSWIPGAYMNGSGPDATVTHKPRALSSDGRRVFFNTQDALVLSDNNLATDVYEWRAPGVGDCTRSDGCLSLISAGLAGSATFVDASGDGVDVFFLTGRSLVGADLGAVDIYTARIGGGFPEPTPPPLCVGDACQTVPPAPEDPVLTTGLEGPGNPEVRFFSALRRCAPLRREARKAARKLRTARRQMRRVRRSKAANPRRVNRIKRRAQKLERRAQKLERRAKRQVRAARACARHNRKAVRDLQQGGGPR